MPEGKPRTLLFALVLSLLVVELRSFPHPVEPVWAGDRVPRLLHFAKTLPTSDLLASLPQDDGLDPLQGDAGMALHNYLALYHKHRFVNGQSSWTPAVTDLARRSLAALPDEASRRALLSMGAKHLLIFGEQLPPQRRGLPELLDGYPERYRSVFKDGNDRVLSLETSEDPTLDLMAVPPLPDGARQIPREELRLRAGSNSGQLVAATDGDLQTRWSSGRPQRPGDFLDVRLARPSEVVALEIENPGRPFDVPASFVLRVDGAPQTRRVLLRRNQVRLYREQIFSPKTFVFRLVFEEPVELDRLRLVVGQVLPGYYFSVAELRLYELPND